MIRQRAAVLLLLVCFPAFATAQRGGPIVRCNLRGKVLHAGNLQPAPRIRVKLVSSGTQFVTQQTLTDSTGAFEFTGLARDSSFTVEISEEGYQAVRMGADVFSGCSGDVTIVLQPTGGTGSQPAEETVSLDELQTPKKARKAFAKGVRELDENRRPERSVPHFRKAIEVYPEYSEAYVQLSRAHIYQEQYAEAQEVLEKATELSPESARPYILLGILYRQQGKADRSHQVLQQALALDPDAWLAHLELGNTLLATGKFEEAYRHARRAHELNPRPTSVHILLYNLCVLRRDFPAALEELDEFLELHPESSWAAQARLKRTALRASLGLAP